jgi:hypothetical protein
MTPIQPNDMISWSTIIAVGAPILAAFGGLLVFLFSRFVKALETNYDTKFGQVTTRLAEINDRIGVVFAAHEKLRDKWDDFLREYLKIDSTRGQKIDALFRVVDEMQNSLKEVRPALTSKIEDSFCRSVSELKVYVRDQIRAEISHAGK